MGTLLKRWPQVTSDNALKVFECSNKFFKILKFINFEILFNIKRGE